MEDILSQDNDDSFRDATAKSSKAYMSIIKHKKEDKLLSSINKKLVTRSKKDEIVEDQLDDLDLNSEHSKNDYILVALHYKALCKSYKKQLADSNKKINELEQKIEKLDRKRKANLELVKFETDENMKLMIEKCGMYCKKINDLIDDVDQQTDETNNVVSTANVNNLEDEYGENFSQEMIIKTLQNIIRERREIKNFIKPFSALIKQVNPNQKELQSKKYLHSINFTQINQIIKDTLLYLNENSLDKYHCKCNNYYDYQKSNKCEIKDETSAFFPLSRKKLNSAGSSSCSSSVSSSSLCLSSSSSSSAIQSPKFSLIQPSSTLSSTNYSSYNRHKPSPEYLLNCVNLFQNLFDVDCFLNVPTKLNELYYKYGQLQNFRNVSRKCINLNHKNSKLILFNFKFIFY
jgi:hypothetical protein